LLNISAICSFNQSTSFRAENVNSSVSAAAICKAEDRSSATHGADPTCSRVFARMAAMILNQNNVLQMTKGSKAGLGLRIGVQENIS
jgi:hypothetical protein